MTNSLLVVAWPYNNTILTSFRFATSYSMPQLYKGNATLTQISSNITANHFTLVFRCQNCLKWSHGGQVGSAATSAKQLVLGWVQAYPSPGNPQCPDMITLSQHNNGMNIWSATLSNNSVSSSYSSWAAKATKTVKGNCDGLASATVSAVPVPTATSYDYIIVGAGAGGIPLADKLSEAGKSVLLIEKGPVSSGRWGGTLKPKWLEGTNLTRFDVPGLCNQIWVDAGGIACTDTDQMAGCVLGGGTAVNAGLWWKVRFRNRVPFAASILTVTRYAAILTRLGLPVPCWLEICRRCRCRQARLQPYPWYRRAIDGRQALPAAGLRGARRWSQECRMEAGHSQRLS